MIQLEDVDRGARTRAFQRDPWAWIRAEVWTVDEVDKAHPVKPFNGEETGVVLYRFTAKDAIRRSTRLGSGIWYNNSWQPLGTAANVGTP
jgi:hypothetical protein